MKGQTILDAYFIKESENQQLESGFIQPNCNENERT